MKNSISVKEITAMMNLVDAINSVAYYSVQLKSVILDKGMTIEEYVDDFLRGKDTLTFDSGSISKQTLIELISETDKQRYGSIEDIHKSANGETKLLKKAIIEHNWTVEDFVDEAIRTKPNWFSTNNPRLAVTREERINHINTHSV